MPLKHVFKTSYGQKKTKRFDLYVIQSTTGKIGIGENPAFDTPDYIEETLQNGQEIARNFLLPKLFEKPIGHPAEVVERFSSVQGNFMVKSAIEAAVWDLYCQENGRFLSSFFESPRTEIPVGVSIGIQDSPSAAVAAVKRYVEQGYRRVKLKIAPGNDSEPLHAIRQAFPDILLMADANSAYTLEDAAVFRSFDSLNLAMIEQPLGVRDFVGHAKLQADLRTPICFDESIRSVEDVETAAGLKSCRAINLKLSRVGGIQAGFAILQACKRHQLSVWQGGMFESGIGRALNLQFASQAQLAFPGDLSGSDRYYEEDIVKQPLRVRSGKMAVPKKWQNDQLIDWKKVTKYGLEKEVLTNK